MVVRKYGDEVRIVYRECQTDRRGLNMKKNVILITVDCLRSDHLSCYGYNKDITPNLNYLANRGALFLQAISNGPYTGASFPVVFSSEYPCIFPKEYENINQLNPPRFLSQNGVLLAEVLKKNNYSTGAFQDSNPYISSYYGYNRGFDFFEDFLNLSKTKSSAHSKWIKQLKSLLRRHEFFQTLIQLWGFVKTYIFGAYPIQGAERITKEAISWVEKQARPFFLWIHYMDVHEPYVPPNEYLKRFRWIGKRLKHFNYDTKNMYKTELKLLISLYDGEIRYADQAIGLLLEKLQRLNILNDTFIVVTADHGEEFGEHGEFQHHPKLYDELLHVPLIIAGPGIQKIEVKKQVGLIDLAPTILDLLNIPKVDVFCGTSLVPLLNGLKDEKTTPVISEYFSEGRRGISYRTNEWKYIVLFEYASKQIIQEELYNLQSNPVETINLVNSEREKVKELRSKVLSHIAIEEQRAIKYEEANIKGKIKRLKDLGKI